MSGTPPTRNKARSSFSRFWPGLSDFGPLCGRKKVARSIYKFNRTRSFRVPVDRFELSERFRRARAIVLRNTSRGRATRIIEFECTRSSPFLSRSTSQRAGRLRRPIPGDKKANRGKPSISPVPSDARGYSAAELNFSAEKKRRENAVVPTVPLGLPVSPGKPIISSRFWPAVATGPPRSFSIRPLPRHPIDLPSVPRDKNSPRKNLGFFPLFPENLVPRTPSASVPASIGPFHSLLLRANGPRNFRWPNGVAAMVFYGRPWSRRSLLIRC